MDPRLKKLIFWGILGGLALFVLFWAAIGKMESPFESGDSFGMWLAAFLTICVLSFLYSDNPIYKFAEALFIGVSAAYVMVQGVWDALVEVLLTKLWPEVAIRVQEIPAAPPAWNDLAPELGASLVATPSPGDRLFYLLPLFLGILLLWRLAPKGGWIARWPLAFIVGWSAGTNLVRFLVSDFAEQVDATLIPLVVLEAGSLDWMQTFSHIVLVVGCLAALIYFFFSVEHKGAFGYVSRLGIWILMITFGAAFGYTVMGRIALLVGRMEFLFIDWMHVISQQ